MSKNDGVQHFVIMKSRIFLIILGFIQSVYCLEISNITNDESYPVCPVSLFRRKRANMEYTRWRSDLETTGATEFIVKVLEDEIVTKPIVAVNILPAAKRGEKIIVGGAMVPPPSTTPPDVQPKDYTRFMPPTTTSEARDDEELYFAPAHHPSIEHPHLKPKGRKEEPAYPQIYAAVKHALRDESPPASPQFLSRKQTSIIRQYAPISPVVFNRRNSLSPLTPPAYHMPRTEGPSPTRSSPLSDILSPTRTAAHDLNFPVFQPFVEEDVDTKEIFLTRSTVQSIPSRSSPLADLTTEKILGEEDSRTTERIAIDVPYENDSGGDSYHSMFYHDDYKDNDLRKKGGDIVENDEETTVRFEEIYSNESVEATYDSAPETTTGQNTVDRDDVDDDDHQTIDDDDHQMKHSNNMSLKMAVTGVADDDLKVLEYNIVKERVGREKALSKPCNIRKLRKLTFSSPRTLQEIVVQLKKWAEESPLVKWVDITNGNFTAMENPIHLMIVDDPSSGQIVTAKQTIMVVAGIQGRDHHAVAAAMYLLYQLIERSESHSDLLSRYRFWIVPVFNPDGYDYSMTFPHRREWTKNLRQSWESCKVKESCGYCEAYGLRCTIQPCYGVNLDRNFEYQWIPTEELRAEHPCGTLYAGERQLSEVETRALTQYLHGLHMHHSPIYCFVAFKEGDVLGIMYPYSHTKKKRAYEYFYKQRASRAASAAYSISGRPYLAGQTSEFLPLHAGGIEDWVEGHLGIDNTYTIMMFRPSDSYTKLITEHVVHEAYAAIDTLLLHQTISQEVRLATSFQRKTLPSITLILSTGLLSICLKLIAF